MLSRAMLGILLVILTAHCGRVRLDLAPVGGDGEAGDTGENGGSSGQNTGAGARGGTAGTPSFGGRPPIAPGCVSVICLGSCRLCDQNNGCPRGERCDPCGRCVDCSENDDCDPDSVCDVFTGRCFRGCRDDMDCDGERKCEEVNSLPLACADCAEDNDCTNPDEGRCAESRCVECRETFHCDGQPCIDGRCGCIFNRDCPSRNCQDGECREPMSMP